MKDRPNIGKVAIHQTGRGDDIRNALHRLTQHIVSRNDVPFGARPAGSTIYPYVYNGTVKNLKPLEWMGDSLKRLRDAPLEIRSEAGHQLEKVQQGMMPEDFRPMPDVGSGVVEIRLI